MAWDPDQYSKFRAQRAAPFYDLAQLISVKHNVSVIDLGCGTGELTAKLAEMLPDSRVLGVDTSTPMLTKAAALATPTLQFAHRDLSDVTGTWDVVFSHAAIQWVDNHEQLIPRLLKLVNPGGQLAIQMPSNHHHPSHLIAQQLATEQPYQNALQGFIRISPVLPIERYADLLFQCGAQNIVVFEKVYPHLLDDADAIFEWTKGTTLIPYLDRLPEDLRDPFLQSYRSRLRDRYPQAPVFYGFKRILFAADKPITAE